MRNTMIALATLAVPAAAFGVFDLKITEVYEGVDGDDITGDWIEITNFGDTSYTFGVDGNLWYDDSSANPTEDEMVTGITAIAPGESVVVVLENAPGEVTTFVNAWGPANLAGVQVGYLLGDDPGGLSQGGEDLYLFDGNTGAAGIVDTVLYLGVDNGTQGSTWTWDPNAGNFPGTLQSVSGVNGAYTAPTAAGDSGEFALIGSPGRIVPAPGAAALLGLAGIAGLRRRRA